MISMMNSISGKRAVDSEILMKMILLLHLLCSIAFAYGREYSSDNSGSIRLVQVRPSAHSRVNVPAIQESSMPTSPRFAPSDQPEPRTAKPSLQPAHASVLPTYRDSPARRSSTNSLLEYHRHNCRKRSHPTSPSIVSGCHKITCVKPLILTPMSSLCACTIPMKVKLRLGVELFEVLLHSDNLVLEIAAGTCLKPSHVRIASTSPDCQNQQKTVVEITLVPLGDKFDNATASMIYRRFWKKKMPINMDLFGDYEMIDVSYPGLPPSPPSYTYVENGPSKSPKGSPPADVHSKYDKMKAVHISIITLSGLLLLLVFFGGVSVLLKSNQHGTSSTTNFPAFTSPNARKSGIRYIISSDIASSTPTSLVSSMATCRLLVRTFSLAELEKATRKFSSKRILGEGGFGRVYQGTLEDGTNVAVKLLKRVNQKGYREFISEVETLSRLHHRNVVKLVGICIEEHPRCLVYELVQNGSVEFHLHGSRNKRPLNWDTRMKIALGAARGLAYLHEESNPRIIHRDFKASNILLEDDFTPKVSDFGLAMEATEGSDHISTGIMGTFGYVAPEYAMTGQLFVKSDVYSYGVVLLELLSGRIPVDTSQPDGQEHLVTWARQLPRSREGLEQLVDPELAGHYDFDKLAQVAAIAIMCVRLEVTQRPFMGEVVQALKLVHTDKDEACGECGSQESSSSGKFEFKGYLSPSDGSWGYIGDATLPLTHGYDPSLITMECSSGPFDEMDDSPLGLVCGRGSLPTKNFNRSGPLRTTHKPAFASLRRSMSDNGGFVWSAGG